jgi:ABC-2 type transport system ATP-binding protein
MSEDYMANELQTMIEVEGLTKLYGDFVAIANLNFSVKKGEIVGLLGPNGSGKTTTMRILTGYMPPSEGIVKIAGYDVLSDSLSARARIGYLPETVPLYQDMEVGEYLTFMGAMRGMNNAKIKTRIDEVVDQVNIGHYLGTHIGKLSKGYKQRVGLAQAILHEPDVLILDEPTIGIDPIQVVETRQLIKAIGKDHTLLLSTHILSEVSALCERVLIIHEGKLVAEDTPENLGDKLRGGEKIQVDIHGPIAEVTTFLRNIEGVISVRQNDMGDVVRYIIDIKLGTSLLESLADLILQQGWGLRGLNSVSMSLEEIFLQLTSSDLKEEG